MTTLTVKTVTEVSRGKVLSAMMALGIAADLELEAGKGAQYDFAELTNDEGNVVWSTDSHGSGQARRFFDVVWA